VRPALQAREGELIRWTSRPGDRVLFGSTAGTEIKLEDIDISSFAKRILAKLSGRSKSRRK